ncbi:MAG TPA: COX15/CtaA family protein [Thermoleophilaceae bacterium]|jgi:cytochrome c oxidase assembly protein subunit 15
MAGTSKALDSESLAGRGASLRARFAVSPELYRRVTLVAVTALALIVLTGAAVRLTGSGLGCPDWPKCYGRTIPPLQFHTVIEFGNRMITGLVGVIVIAASGLAFFRRPYRRHLAILGVLLPLGVVGQAVLGGLVVRYDLNPYLVMSHFLLSMLLLDASFALAWCAAHDPGWREASRDRLGTWSVRALIPFGQLTVLLGTMATGAGPHAGEHSGQLVKRFTFEGRDTLSWMVARHGAVAAAFGVAAVLVWFIDRRAGADRRASKPLTVLCLLLLAQGILGFIQYRLHVPSGMVWVHVTLATASWLCTLWAVASAGRLAPRVRESEAGLAAPAGA